MALSYKQNVQLNYKIEETIKACAKDIINEIYHDKWKLIMF